MSRMWGKTGLQRFNAENITVQAIRWRPKSSWRSLGWTIFVFS